MSAEEDTPPKKIRRSNVSAFICIATFLPTCFLYRLGRSEMSPLPKVVLPQTSDIPEARNATKPLEPSKLSKSQPLEPSKLSETQPSKVSESAKPSESPKAFKKSPRKFANLSTSELASFSPRDGLICYEGPVAAATILYTNIRASIWRYIYIDSKLHQGRCLDRGYKINVGNTCFGDTFAATKNLKPHSDDEAYSVKHFVEKGGKLDYDASPGCIDQFQADTPPMYEALPAAGIVNFGPRDGIICYQGPIDGQTKLFNKVKLSTMRFIFEDSQLHSGPCEKRGFTKTIGNTCFGDTYISSWNLKKHTDDEAYSYIRFLTEFGEKAAATYGKAGCLKDYL